MMRRHEQDVIRGLVGEDYQVLYWENPWFKQGLDMFVRTLPYFVAGLASEAREKGEKMAADLRALQEGHS